MLEDVTRLLEQYRGMLRDAVSACDPVTQGVLAPVIDVALAGIEGACPLVSLECAHGGPPVLHWGPEGTVEARFVIIAATPEKSLAMRIGEWFEPLAIPAGIPPATMWAVIGMGVAENSGDDVAHGIVSRLASAGTWPAVREAMTLIRADGMTPALVTMTAIVGETCAGVGTLLVLPADVAVQVAQSEAAIMGLARMN